MSEVIPFPEPEDPDAWQCGCQAFYILDSYEAECCDNEIDLFDCY